tara:strand:+ start:120 stop:365 length:246 start_codon:yes stop_codon:yes gene_type:complete
MRDKDAQLMMEAQWGTGTPGAVHPDLANTTGYLLDLSTQKLTTLNGQAVMGLTKNLKPVDSEGGVTYAYDNFVVIIPNQET